MKNENIKYFKVVAKCGHVGRNQYIPQSFAVMAESGEEAAKKTRNIPRVKHHKKDAILSVEEITFEQYLEIKELNDNNPYFKCSSKQDQKRLCDLEGLVVKEVPRSKKNNKETRVVRVKYKIKKDSVIKKICWEDYDYEYNYCY